MSPRDTFLKPPALEENGFCLTQPRVPFGRSDQDEAIELAIAHEINQPLAAIALHSAAARKWLCRAEPNIERALASLDLICEAGRHAGDIVRVIKRHACDEASEIDCVNVDETIGDVLRLLRCSLDKHGIHTEIALNLRGTTLHANRIQLQQVVTNLVVNAIEALSEVRYPHVSRHIKVGSHIVHDHEVEITVEDNGPGITRANRDRIFSNRFTTKVGSTGVGLSISHSIIRAHGGWIAVESCDPHGARFRIRLPRHRPKP